MLMAAGAGEAGTRAGELAREVASEVGVELDEDGTNVIDHLNFDVKARIEYCGSIASY